MINIENWCRFLVISASVGLVILETFPQVCVRLTVVVYLFSKTHVSRDRLLAKLLLICKSKLQWGIYHLTPVRMAIIKKTTNNINTGEGVEKKIPALLVECKLAQPLWETVRSFLKETKYLSYDPAVLLLGIYIEKKNTLTLKRYTHPNTHGSATYNSQNMEATCVPWRMNGTCSWRMHFNPGHFVASRVLGEYVTRKKGLAF